jgi:PTS system mannitol-specific IIC component
MNSPKYDEIVELVRNSNDANAGGAAVENTTPETTAGAQPAAAVTPEAAAPGTSHGAHAAEPAAAVGGKGVLLAESVKLNGSAQDRDSAIDEAGQLLLDRDAVDVSYVHAMHEREESVSTYMGSFLAIPHGTNEAKDHIKHSAVSIVRYPEGIDWGGKQVKFVVGVAGLNNEHLHILSSIAKIFTNKAQVARLEEATTVEEVLELFGKVNA